MSTTGTQQTIRICVLREGQSDATTTVSVVDPTGLTRARVQTDENGEAEVIQRARRAAWRYFDHPVPAADVDDADDEGTKQRLAAMQLCALVGDFATSSADET